MLGILVIFGRAAFVGGLFVGWLLNWYLGELGLFVPRWMQFINVVAPIAAGVFWMALCQVVADAAEGVERARFELRSIRGQMRELRG